ncbi:MAG: YggS family pyridoxal phosphate-dependent enzyme [Deltaproteobacteria bacterium]|nr:YggS family pyridoxal phosphate-dependent enzyme [Deltaproteobacteria bacterium]
MTEGAASSLRDRLERIRKDLRSAEERAGREPGVVKLLAVTKKVSPATIREAWELGVRAFGENYVQEALAKADELPPDIEWHFIGRLQTNKAKLAVERFSVIECLDRPSLADALENAARSRGIRVRVLVQVNAAGEETKAGAPPEGAVELVRRAPEWPHLEFGGLMVIPPYSLDPEETRPHFRALRELRDRIAALRLPGVDLRELSMGMSGDYEVAVEEGATIVRIGTALFGPRVPSE